ncbi:hypothetical protein PF008_g11274 [Phytophthora fragariae]|nr:hypothetical protein PF008_g11274 [Phytophthora fragariae]
MGDIRLGLALHALRLSTYAAYSTAYPQNFNGSPLANSMQRAMFRIVLCIRSALPFEAWLLASLTCRRTLVARQKSSTFMYSPPPSVRSTCMRQLYSFSKKTRKCSNFFVASTLFLARNALT